MPGTYDVRVSGTQTLSRKVDGVVLADGANPTIDFGTLLAGAVNGDNIINVLDFSILAASFGKRRGDAGFDARADLNGDGVVNILDFSWLRTNFGQVGAP